MCCVVPMDDIASDAKGCQMPCSSSPEALPVPLPRSRRPGPTVDAHMRAFLTCRSEKPMCWRTTCME